MRIDRPEEYTQMVKDLAKPGEAIIASLNPHSAHLLHMAIGIAGEAGEKLEAILAGDMVNLKEECGDLEFYIEGMMMVDDIADQVGSLRLADVHDYIKSLGTVLSRELVLIVSLRLLDYIKKMSVYVKPIDLPNVCMQLAALRVLLDDLYTRHMMSRDSILDGNVHKLLKGNKARYKAGKYSDEQAQARADKADEELRVMVSINGSGCALDGELLDTGDVAVLLTYARVCELADKMQVYAGKANPTITYSAGEDNGELTPDSELYFLRSERNVIVLAETSNA